jgi:quercetin dioxygenase-like cupin family protein
VQIFEAGLDVWLSSELGRGGYATWEPGRSCPVHVHEGAFELFVFLDGECEVEVEGESWRLGGGHAAYIAPDERHRITAVGDRPLHMFLAVSPNRPPTTTYFRSDGTPVPWDDRPEPHPDTQEEVDAL